jgi:ABC-type phosphate transport system permease subunit
MTLTRRILLALIIGVSLTFLLAWIAFQAEEAGFDYLSNVLFWQNALLQSRVPPPNIGTVDHPFYEGMPLVILAFLLSFPIGFIVYGVGAFVIISRIVERQGVVRPVA